MKKPMWNSEAVKAYETGQGVELVATPHPYYRPLPEELKSQEKTMKVEGPLHVVCQCDKCKTESQEPVKYEHKAYTMPPQPEQKNLADDFFKTIADKNPKPFPPSQRTWVGLTFREQQEAILNTHSIHEALIKAEAKLKEKNT